MTDAEAQSGTHGNKEGDRARAWRSWSASRRRRGLQGEATDAGLGSVRMVHRSRLPLWTRPFAPLLTAVVGGLCLVLVLMRNPVAALCVALLIPAGLFAYATAAPSRLRGGRQFIAVCDGGLVIAHEYLPARAVPWTQVQEWRTAVARPGVEQPDVLVIEGEDEETEIPVGAVHRRGDLVRALARRSPAPPNYRRGVSIAAAMAVFAGLLGWLAHWQFDPRHEEALPSIDHLGAACDYPGVAYDGAAAYDSSRPRQLVIYQKTTGDYDRHTITEPANTSSAISPEAVDKVQLIACVHRSDDPYGDITDTRCEYVYGDGTAGRPVFGQQMPDRVLNVQIVHYVVDVYELRTHRKVTSRRVDGDDMTCPGSLTATEAVYSQISDTAFHRLLDPLTR
ncbi:hypothetical protein JK359_32120 [Streptomyces actinomycinicus]|uniref:Uncharacterized protein n=1 Tax=Streptomyces actinomycinicus TaxID=1695166 RepID=A0A937EQ90_9ACTN|nr:hypothetical protein [Streptomyces actinomycinicus]MBL1086552.1 hypothetical protein [Streptomyces actinomycinicus]